MIHLQQIVQRLSLRKPQEEALQRLQELVNILSLKKDINLEEELNAIHNTFPLVTNFERDFPNFCFSLATGVGKTRLMGAFIAYLHLVKGVKNFFILAPNNTILEKLTREFSEPSDPKYVFHGIPELYSNSPSIITHYNFSHSNSIRNDKLQQPDMFNEHHIQINIFNIAMIHTKNRSIKKPNDYLPEGYYQYLSELKDLVILMDEAHHYRAPAALKAINELKPILGLELTATPTSGPGDDNRFSNIIYEYDLSHALKDGLLKNPIVIGKVDFNKANYTDTTLEQLKIKDGIHIHELKKQQLKSYASLMNQRAVKPIILIIAKDTEHADALQAWIQSDECYSGKYKDKVQCVHSSLKKDEEEKMIRDLLAIEAPDNPIEIVIHVNMLKEGWDVVNLYTIIPLRKANSKILIEQSLGRGLRLPYGKRIGGLHADIDELAIISHDKFNDIINEANKPHSLLRGGKLLGKDIPLEVNHTIDTKPNILSHFNNTSSDNQALVKDYLEKKHTIASCYPSKEEFFSFAKTWSLEHKKIDPGANVETLAEQYQQTLEAFSICIPHINIYPTTVSTSKYKHFILDFSSLKILPINNDLIARSLSDASTKKLTTPHGYPIDIDIQKIKQALENTIFDQDDIIDTEKNCEVVTQLIQQIIDYLQNLLKNDLNTYHYLKIYKEEISQFIYKQMRLYYEPSVIEYKEEVYNGYLKLPHYRQTISQNHDRIHFTATLDKQSYIKNILFYGFKKSSYLQMKFDSNPEKIFCSILENSNNVMKWMKIPRNSFSLYYRNNKRYEPDFIIEAMDHKYLCEIKQASEIINPIVQEKAEIAVKWCRLATEHAKTHDSKAWSYLLIPHDIIDRSKSFDYLSKNYIHITKT